MQDTLKSKRSIVVVDYCGELILVNTGFFEAVVCSASRKATVILDTSKALFLGCGNDLAVLDLCRGGVVVEAGEPEDEGRLLNCRTISPLRRSYFGRRRQQSTFSDLLFEEMGYLLVTKRRKMGVVLEA